MLEPARNHIKYRRPMALLALALSVITSGAAHNGPPFPIIVDRQVGPCVLSLWTHPDVGIGTFFVIVNAPKTGKLPGDLAFDIGVLPVTGRLPEARYHTVRQELYGQVQYNASIPFDMQELWRVNLYVRSSAGTGEATANVEVTPVGLGRWDLLLFGFPFLAVGFLWFRAMLRRGKSRSKLKAS
jgi:hypothetical protein